jgi:hypothetical protein
MLVAGAILAIYTQRTAILRAGEFIFRIGDPKFGSSAIATISASIGGG